MTEERLTVLETKITFQEQIIEELNQLVTQQQLQIDKITQKLNKISTLFESHEESDIVDISLEVPPPHY